MWLLEFPKGISTIRPNDLVYDPKVPNSNSFEIFIKANILTDFPGNKCG